MPPGPGMTWGFNAEILVNGGILCKAILLALSATLVASVYPAWKASRMSIVDALRQGQ
jgi:putative ABC transport system permease protein